MSQMQEPGDVRFPNTSWSLVERAGATESIIRRPSLAELLSRYRPALSAYLTQTRRISPQRADDLLQDFLTAKFLDRNITTQADRRLGRFRSFILASLDHFLIDQNRRASAEKRFVDQCAIADPEILAAQAAEESSAAHAFDVAWAKTLLARVLELVHEECTLKGREDLWAVFEQRVLGPIFDGTTPPEYTKTAQELGFRSAAQACNALTTAKRMFERTLREVVAEYIESPDVDDEINELHAILAKSRS